MAKHTFTIIHEHKFDLNGMIDKATERLKELQTCPRCGYDLTESLGQVEVSNNSKEQNYE